MPGNLLNADVTFPSLTDKQSTDEKFSLITNYLRMLLEQLRYSMGNLGVENFNATELDSLVNLITEPIYVQLQDEAGNIASVAATAEQLISRMTDAEGNISSLQQTSTSIMSQITDLNGNVSTLQQTSQAYGVRLSNVEGAAASLTVTVNGITQSVSDLETGMSQTVRVAANGVTITNAAGESLVIDGGQVNAANLNLTGAITWSDLAEDSQNEINGAYTAAQSAQNTASSAQTTASNAANTAYSAYSLASNANNTVSGWVYPGTTYINGNMLMTGTVKATSLQGGSVALLDSSGSFVGTLGLSSYGYAIDFNSYASLRLQASGSIYFQSASSHILMEGSDISVRCSSLYPVGTAPNLGSPSGGMWQAVYAYTGTIQTSDANFKHDIEPLPEKYIDMLDQVEPKRFKLNNGTSGRYHVGFIAQDIEKAMAEAGIDTMEFGGFVRYTDSDGNSVLMLRYEEMIGILWAKIKKLETRLSAWEETA